MLHACTCVYLVLLSALGHIIAPAWHWSPSVEASSQTALLSSDSMIIVVERVHTQRAASCAEVRAHSPNNDILI